MEQFNTTTFGTYSVDEKKRTLQDTITEETDERQAKKLKNSSILLGM